MRLLSVLTVLAVLATVTASAATSGRAPDNPCVLQVGEDNEPGTRLVITGVVRDAQGKSVGGATMHFYQTDITGRYTKEQAMDEPHARLAGTLILGEAGTFELHTVRPGGYPQAVRLGDRDRHIPAHIHIDVTAAGHPERKMQLVFADDKLLADPYWSDWVVKQRHPVLATQHTDHGETGTLTITLD